MKKLTLIFILSAFVIVPTFISCSHEVPPEYRNKHAYRIDWNGEMFRGSRSQVQAWPEFIVYCNNGAEDCYDMMQENQSYGDVTVHMQRFYNAYSADTLHEYFALYKDEFIETFPDIEEDFPGAVDSLADGYFTVCASSVDSSIVVFRDVNQSTSPNDLLSKIVFAIKRDDH
jgi:hypothetical protein